MRIGVIDESMAMGMNLGTKTRTVIDGTPADAEGCPYSEACQRLKQVRRGLFCGIRAIIER
jgi:hypothetical protein